MGERLSSIEELETAQAVVAQRFVDKLLGLKFRSRRPILLHLEFQTEGDRNMPWRIGQYASLGFMSAMKSGSEPWEPASVVVYLDRRSYREDPGSLELRGALGFGMEVRYKVIRIWELPREPILSMASPGLCPFIPLLAGNPEEGVLQSTRKIIDSRVAAETKRELLALTAALAGVVVRDRDLLHRLLSEVLLMGENYVLDVLREQGEAMGLVKGKAEGRAQGIRLSILRILRKRLGSVPASIRSGVSRVRDSARLGRLLDEAAVAPDWKAFAKALAGKER